jgi:uncharacterized membrane protein YphA (DoxX/SURF4 family)
MITDATDISPRKRVMGSIVDVAIILVVAGLLLASAIDKLLHYQGFIQALKNYVFIPAYTAELIAPVVVLVELFLGTCLLMPKTRRHAALGAGALFTVFSAILAGNHLAGGKGICGCWFTITLAEGTATHIALNVLLALLCVFIYQVEVKRVAQYLRDTPRSN